MIAERTRPTRRVDEIQLLHDLWARQCAHVAGLGRTDPGHDYVAAHFAMEVTLRRHLAVVDQIAPHVRGRVLEWGCRHGLDSCLYRLRFGDGVELHGCDVCDADDYRPFHAYSGLRYQQIHHPYRLDYDDATFDVVTSNGVLEHVPDDAASAGEVFRVLRPGGTFVVTSLPNRFSYTEALQRWRGGPAHDRLYTLRSASRLLEARGFRVVDRRCFLMVPSMLNGFPARVRSAYQRWGRAVWAANSVLERSWPLNRLASNLLLVARKPEAA